MASGRVSMAGPFRQKWGQASLPCLYVSSKFCVNPSLGSGVLSGVGLLLTDILQLGEVRFECVKDFLPERRNGV